MLLNSPKPKPNILELSLQLYDRCHIWNVNFGYCCYHSKNSLAMSEPSLPQCLIKSGLLGDLLSAEPHCNEPWAFLRRCLSSAVQVASYHHHLNPDHHDPQDPHGPQDHHDQWSLTTNITMITKHSWKNAQTAQTHVCHFYSLAVLFLASEHASNVFLYFAVKFVI